MLVQFSVENFLSFDEEQIFSMVATNDDQHPSHVVPKAAKNGESVLRGAAIYGANAAGKSNLIHALHFAQNFILDGSRSKGTISVRPFKLSGPDSDRPSKFEFVIRTQGILYNYGFRLNAKRVLEEWLYATPKTKEVKYFERSTSEEGKIKVEFGSSFKGAAKENDLFLKFVAQSMKPTQLFLSKAVEDNVSQLQPLFDWFEKVLLILAAESKPLSLEIMSHRDQEFTSFLTSLLKTVGTGIEEIKTAELDFDIQRYFPNDPDVVSNISEQVAALPEDSVIQVPGNDGTIFWLAKGKNGQPTRGIFTLQHRAKNDKPVAFTMAEQSEGTQRLINLAPALFKLKTNSEVVLVLDELDRRLHTHLSRFFIQAALECDKEHRQSQLIFTTHDTNLLDLDLLRRDEIWFVEKDEYGASHVYSLTEFKVRPDLRIEKGYLSGRFGAIPFIGDINSLLCEDKVPEDVVDIAA